jgi:hypothetical protein
VPRTRPAEKGSLLGGRNVSLKVLEERSQQMFLVLHLLQQHSLPNHQRNLRRERQSEIAWSNCCTGILVYCSKVVLTLFVGLRPCLVFIYQVYEFILAPLF